MEVKMVTNKYRFALLLTLLLVGGCSGEDGKATPDTSGEELMFERQIQSLDKAEGVEQLLQDGADVRRQAIEQQAE
jgi:hypothetical protein